MIATLLHTADLHKTRMAAICARLFPHITLTHVVRPDWLARAQNGIPEDLETEIAEAIGAAPGPVMCTCTTLGPLVERYGASRVDAPMMTEAAQRAGEILLAYAVPSTRVASGALLDRARAQTGHDARVRELDLSAFWPLFLAGESTAFEAAVAAGVRDALRLYPKVRTVILAQGSMAGAADLLRDSSALVLHLGSPEAALRALLSSE